MTVRIDAHHHVWDLAVRDQPWITGNAMAPLRRSFGIDDLAPDAAAAGITTTIVVQTIADVGETEELLDLAEATPLIHGVVGYVNLAAPDVGEQLDRLQDRPSGAWLAGIRNPIQDEPDPGWLTRPAVLAGLHEIAQRNLVYDLLIRPHHLDAALTAVTHVPEGRYVVDHLAKPTITSAAWQPWANGLATLAAHSNVSAKLSGLVTEADWATWSTSDLQPYAEHALTVFGPDRLLFGSDWPVCTLAAPYDRVVATTEELVAALSADERAAVMSGTAASVYGLDRVNTGTPAGVALGRPGGGYLRPGDTMRLEIDGLGAQQQTLGTA
jgi:L-fuconolactonase